jgi:hypothetical protein
LPVFRWLPSCGACICICICASFTVASGAGAASPPIVEAEWSSDVALDAATLNAEVNPAGTDTTYRFEYGTGAAYGSTVPMPDADAGSGATGTQVSVTLRNLAAGSTYHYRVVAERGAEVEDGPDRTFTTFSASFGGLPDERQYELVSPQEKNGGEIDGGVSTGIVRVPIQAAEDGHAITYASATSFVKQGEQASGSTYLSDYLARRSAGGWSTQNITPPHAIEAQLGALSFEDNTYEAMSPDLSAAFLVANSPLLPESHEGFFMPYRRDNLSGDYRDLSPIAPPHSEPGVYNGGFEPIYAGASSDFSHIVFSANDALTVDAPAETRNLYEWVNGTLRLVDVLPDESAVPPGTTVSFGGGGVNEQQNVDHAISDDGSHVFWTDETDERLYVRVDGARTVLVSGSRKDNGTGPGGTDPGGPQMPVFEGASADGSTVFFTSKSELTDDANTGDPSACGDCGADLYSYDTETGLLTDITPDSQDPNGAEIAGVIGTSEDGSYVYFTADGALAPGATPGQSCGMRSGGDVCNVYVWHAGAGIRLIARLTGYEAESDYIASDQAEERISRVSPDGRFMAFETTEPLTGYDNLPASGASECAGPEVDGMNFGVEPVDSSGSNTRACREVFLYDARSGALACASCNPTGARPLGPSVLPYPVGGAVGNPLDRGDENPGWETHFYQQRYLTDEGRLFFETMDSLTPYDTNARVDVYEYEGGRAYPISDGFGPENSAFLDASMSGDDVFFVTRDQLVPGDKDGAVDLYDARVGAAQGVAAPPPCESSDACKPTARPQPTIFGAPASATFSGTGNVASRSSRSTPSTRRLHKRRAKHRRRSGRRRHRKVKRHARPVAGKR